MSTVIPIDCRHQSAAVLAEIERLASDGADRREVGRRVQEAAAELCEAYPAGTGVSELDISIVRMMGTILRDHLHEPPMEYNSWEHFATVAATRIVSAREMMRQRTGLA